MMDALDDPDVQYSSAECAKHGAMLTRPCWQCGGAGGTDLYDEDPLWFDEDDWEACDVCRGKGSITWCNECATERASGSGQEVK